MMQQLTQQSKKKPHCTILQKQISESRVVNILRYTKQGNLFCLCHEHYTPQQLDNLVSYVSFLSGTKFYLNGVLRMCTLVPRDTHHEFHETCHSITFYSMKKDCKRCCDTTTPESIHTKDESKRGSAFAFIFGVN